MNLLERVKDHRDELVKAAEKSPFIVFLCGPTLVDDNPKPSRLNCCGSGLARHVATPRSPYLNTSTGSTIHGAGIQPSAGKAPWHSKERPLK